MRSDSGSRALCVLAAVAATSAIAAPPAIEFVDGEVSLFGSASWPGGKDSAFANVPILGSGTSGGGSTGSGLPRFNVFAQAAFACLIESSAAPTPAAPATLQILAQTESNNDCPDACFASIGCDTSIPLVFEVRRPLLYTLGDDGGVDVAPITGEFSFDSRGFPVLRPGTYQAQFSIGSNPPEFAQWSITAWTRYPIRSSFGPEELSDGWGIVDLQCDSLDTVATGEVDWFAGGGDPGGHIGAADPSNGCFCFSAPWKYRGNHVDAIGLTLRFSVRSSAENYPQGSVLVLRAQDGALTLVHDFEHPPAGVWTRYSVPLVPGSFRIGSVGGPVPSQAQFESAMSSVAELLIGAEFGSPVVETTWLDSVEFGAQPCPGDIDLDSSVGPVDLARLLAAWGSAGAAEDLDGSGLVGAADLAMLLAAWGACPE